MARNEVLVHLEDRQLADIKKSIKQSQMKTESEINKLRRDLERLRYAVNDILNEMRTGSEAEEDE